MKVNFLYGLIAICISALLAYGTYSFCHSDNELLLALGGFVFMVFPLFMAMGVCSIEKRSSANMKVLATISFLFMLIDNVIFTLLSSFSTPLYIILNGIALLVFFLIYHSIYSTKQ